MNSFGKMAMNQLIRLQMRDIDLKYRVRPRGGAEAQKTLNGRCTLGISMGAHFHEQDKFFSTVLWVNQTFDSCTTLLCDTLQRFGTLEYFRGDLEGAEARSRQEGEEWISRNAGALQSFTIPHKLMRWDDIRLDSAFSKRLEDILELYAESEEMQSLIQEDCLRFINNNPMPGVSESDRIVASRDFLLEEIAGLTLFAERFGPQEVYAGAKIKAIEYLKTCDDKRVPSSVHGMFSIKIDFIKRKNLTTSSSQPHL